MFHVKCHKTLTIINIMQEHLQQFSKGLKSAHKIHLNKNLNDFRPKKKLSHNVDQNLKFMFLIFLEWSSHIKHMAGIWVERVLNSFSLYAARFWFTEWWQFCRWTLAWRENYSRKHKQSPIKVNINANANQMQSFWKIIFNFNCHSPGT